MTTFPAPHHTRGDRTASALRPVSTPRGAGAVLMLAGALVAGALATTCSDSPGDARPPVAHPDVILITLDTTRRDRLGCYGDTKAHTPNIDRIAAEGVRFEHAYTCVPITLPSHSSMMTGNYPFVHGVRDNGVNSLDPANVTLAERLAAFGYHSAAFVSALVLGRMFGLDQGFDVYDDKLHDKFAPDGSIPNRPAGRTTDAALEWLARRPPGPFFLWVHYFDPHMPYEAPPEMRSLVESDYDAEIATMDHAIGRLIGALEQQGVWKTSLVIVAADHGEALGDNGEDTHGFFLYESTTRIPLLIKGPGLPAGTVEPGLVRTVDIVPTVMEMTGARLDPPVQGLSLLGLMHGTASSPQTAYMETYLPHFSFGWSWLEALRLDPPPLKYIDSARPELYDLANDPHEARNLLENRSETARQAAALLAALKSNVAEQVVRAQGGELQGQADRSGLAQLGYVSETAEILEERGPDIKDVYRYKQARDQAMEMSRKGQLVESLEAFREFARHTPRKDRSNEYLGLTLVSLGRRLVQQGRVDEAQPKFEEAISLLEKAAAGTRVRFQVYYHLAVAHFYRKKSSRAEYEHDMQVYEQLLGKTLEIHPDFAPARYFLGMFYAERKRWADAERVLRRYVDQWQPPARQSKGSHEDFGARAATVLGNALFAQNRLGEARKAYQRAAEMKPGYPDYLYYLGQLTRYEGHPAEARVLLERFLEMARNYTAPETQQLVPRVRKMLKEM